MINCGTLCLNCDYPIALDTYSGCEHNCRYCYVKDQWSIDNIQPHDCVSQIQQFADGKRTQKTKWCDWKIPLRWGTMSDPFQPCEKEHKKSLAALKKFAETQYPFIVTTKNPVMLTEEPYISLISQCNCVLQVSMACSAYDKLEPGAPTYAERLEAVKKLSGKVKRILIRVQPYFADKHSEIMKEIPNYADAGAYGIIVEGYTTTKKQKGLIKDGKYCFSLDVLAPRYKKMREECHKYGLTFLCGEDRLVFLGDSLICCGTENLDGFVPNKYNIHHLAHDEEDIQPTKAMQEKDTGYAFRDFHRTPAWRKHIVGMSYDDLMSELGDDYILWYQELREKWDK